MSTLKQITQDTLHFFAVFCVIFLPFPFHFFAWQTQLSQALFGRLTSVIAQQVLGISSLGNQIASDTLQMYVLVAVLAIVGLWVAVMAAFFRQWQPQRSQVLAWVRLILHYYLALLLLKYGVDKVFKVQFYLPEPNTLYTPLGQLSKDILFWSTMGLSYGYTVFAGALEVLAGTLILFRKTRTLGLLVAVGILGNVVAINFGFDISVKIYSLFLLFLALLLSSPQWMRLYQFLVLQHTTQLKLTPQVVATLPTPQKWRIIAKSLVVALLLAETLLPYIQAGNFNDDTYPRPALHGVYEVTKVSINQQNIPLQQSPIKRVFIHRRGFMIFENMQANMRDFRLQVDTAQQQLLLTGYQQEQTRMHYQYSQSDSTLTLRYTEQGQAIKLTTKALNWRKLPAIQSQFHWSIDADLKK